MAIKDYTNHIHVHTSKAANMLTDTRFLNQLEELLTKKRCRDNYTQHSKNLISAFAGSNPQIDLRNIQLLIALARYTLLYDVNTLSQFRYGFISITNISLCIPSSSTLNNWIEDLAAMQIIIAHSK